MHRAKLNMVSAALILAVVSLFCCGPAVMAYFSSQSTASISINATPVEEIWAVSGAFDEGAWASTGSSGIYVNNKTDQDMWVYFEYSGSLEQVFKQANPEKIPAGQSAQIPLKPLDGTDTPRILNPQALITTRTSGEGISLSTTCSWVRFKGTVKARIMNDYDSWESPEISISGKTLWGVYFKDLLGSDPDTYIKSCYSNVVWENEAGNSVLNLSSKNLLGTGNGTGGSVGEEASGIVAEALSGEALSSKTVEVQASTLSLLEGLVQYKPLEFVLPVLQAVDQVAPGLLQERSFYQESMNKLIAQSQQLCSLLDMYRTEVSTLTGLNQQQAKQIEDLNIQVGNLNVQISDKDARIAELERQLALQSVPVAPAPVEASVSTEAAPAATAVVSPAETTAVPPAETAPVVGSAPASTGTDTSSEINPGSGSPVTGSSPAPAADYSNSASGPTDTGTSTESGSTPATNS